MNPREDDDLPFDDSDDNDPVIRELRMEMVRLDPRRVGSQIQVSR